MYKQRLILIVVTLLFSINCYADVKSSKKAITTSTGRPCPVSGIVALQQYVRARDRQCFRSALDAQAFGLVAFDETSAQKVTRSKIKRCRYLAVKGEQMFFSSAQIKCFKNIKRAERRGYQRYEQKPTPTPPPNGTPPIVTPGPTPTPIVPTGGEMTFSFALGGTTPESEYSGNCSAVLSAARTEVSIFCTHNVTDASEAHMHIVPDNDKYCVLTTPPLSFTVSCALTPELGERVAHGNGLVAIHQDVGGEGQALAGLMR